ncbi:MULTISPECIES: Cro/CI family transcriptional regulator [Pseudomonas]|uniref:Cro/Cl family transcriptional regulator n=1 Tax=Pseudomonas luteola TaxID=47886 RepID=A0ABS0FPN7_PSELU|nr:MULTISPECIES: Cro/CI family transcriptional regulator [Pseudomonas]MBF8642295.1 Cro/Cl family transcriptional regulator [Pseudomonas zeshuii]RRW48323.1 Cro/Cl family transcriptional regulator [Pseudomonas luteola]SHJ23817.1 DNA-binding transcriptional regulator Cro [Pseudomonas zeshuii]
MTKTQAINHFGGISRLAKALGITYEAVRQWPEQIPELRQFQIERLTEGALMIDVSPKDSNQAA